MDFGIAGKVALVSGGSKGMGRACAEELAAEGCDVVVAARGQDAIDATVDAIKRNGGVAAGVSADMADGDGIRRAIAFANDTFGPVDIAVANVYGPTHGHWRDTRDEDFREAYEQMVMSVVHLVRGVEQHMVEQGWGRIVIVGGVNAKEPHLHLPLLTANITRVGVVSLSKALAHEFGRNGITVNTLAPAGFFTDRYKSYMAKRAAEEGRAFDPEAALQNDELPLGRLGLPEEFGAVCAFLCSTRASYLTGQMVVVDGGRVHSLF